MEGAAGRRAAVRPSAERPVVSTCRVRARDPLARLPREPQRQPSRSPTVYAIVKTGGKQYKVAVGDVVEVEKLAGDAGASVSLPALLVVDGDLVLLAAGLDD